MPGPFAQPAAPTSDVLTDALEKGARARQVLQLGVGEDLDRRRVGVLKIAENELRSGKLTPERALMHLACCNALRAYHEELNADILGAQKAADRLHAEDPEPETDAS